MYVFNRPSEVPAVLESRAFSDYLKIRIETALRSLQAESLEKYGSIFVIESTDDWTLSEEIHLSMPLYDYPVEFAERLTFGELVFYHGCICVNNDCSVDVYCLDDKMCNKASEDWLANIIS